MKIAKLVVDLSLWKIWVKVSWDDDSIPNWMESHQIPWFQTTNQIVGLPNLKMVIFQFANG